MGWNSDDRLTRCYLVPFDLPDRLLARWTYEKNMNIKEKKLLVHILKHYREMRSRAGCNDVPAEWFADWTEEEIAEFNKNSAEGNLGKLFEDMTDAEKEDYATFNHKYDWIVASDLADKLLVEIATEVGE